jgi:hypothetical protein
MQTLPALTPVLCVVQVLVGLRDGRLLQLRIQRQAPASASQQAETHTSTEQYTDIVVLDRQVGNLPVVLLPMPDMHSNFDTPHSPSHSGLAAGAPISAMRSSSASGSGSGISSDPASRAGSDPLLRSMSASGARSQPPTPRLWNEGCGRALALYERLSLVDMQPGNGVADLHQLALAGVQYAVPLWQPQQAAGVNGSSRYAVYVCTLDGLCLIPYLPGRTQFVLDTLHGLAGPS